MRYVDDGDVITSAGVLSGVDATLRVVERMLGPTPAQRAVDVAWPDYSPGVPAPIPLSKPAAADAVGLLSGAYRWDRPRMGVLVTDGLGEIDLAAAFRPYELSYLAQPVALTVDGQPIRSRHGLTFVPRADLPSAAPGWTGWWCAARSIADGLRLPERLLPVYLHAQPGFGFDGALRDISSIYDVASARWVAKTLQYPNTNPQLSGRAWPWSLTVRPILIAGAAVVGVLIIQRLLRRRIASAAAESASGCTRGLPPLF